jgi:hypothetical protein
MRIKRSVSTAEASQKSRAGSEISAFIRYRLLAQPPDYLYLDPGGEA